MLLTSQMVLNHQRCPRQVYLDTFADRCQKGRPSDFRLKLAKDRLQHQKTFLKHQPGWVKPEYPKMDWQAGAQATLELMRQGQPQIQNPVLLFEHPQGLTLVSTPDCLIRASGVSVFGDWVYAPADIKLSKRPKPEYQVVLTYHAYVLSLVQEAAPPMAWLHLREKWGYEINLDSLWPKLDRALTDLKAILIDQVEPEVFIVRNRCQLCPWFTPCYALAQTTQHLSLLPGVTPSRYPMLQNQGLETVEALATLEASTLNQLTGFGYSVSQQLICQAQAWVTQGPILLSDANSQQWGAVQFNSPIELYFDIEAEPSIDVVYLHGVLLVDRRTGDQQFYPFLAENPEQEQQAWVEFLALVQAYPTAPIYHFCPYEVQTVKRLARLYDTPMTVVEALVPRFVDIHRWVTDTVTLPIENYTLKVIARWMGFEWRNSEANGAQSICWYEEWLNTGDRTFLDTIVTYNEDDCLATYRIKAWLDSYLDQRAIARLSA